jgi:hypothetical protein
VVELGRTPQHNASTLIAFLEARHFGRGPTLAAR